MATKSNSTCKRAIKQGTTANKLPMAVGYITSNDSILSNRIADIIPTAKKQSVSNSTGWAIKASLAPMSMKTVSGSWGGAIRLVTPSAKKADHEVAFSECSPFTVVDDIPSAYPISLSEFTAITGLLKHHESLDMEYLAGLANTYRVFIASSSLDELQVLLPRDTYCTSLCVPYYGWVAPVDICASPDQIRQMEEWSASGELGVISDLALIDTPRPWIPPTGLANVYAGKSREYVLREIGAKVDLNSFLRNVPVVEPDTKELSEGVIQFNAFSRWVTDKVA